MLRSLCLAIAAGIVAAPSAYAQYGVADGALSGTGTVVIERTPELMRMQVQLLASAPNMKDALAALKKRQDSATAQAVALGAVKDSVKVEPAALVEGTNDRNRQIQMMMRQRMQAGGARRKPAAKTTEPVRLSTTFTAEWPLKAKSHDEMLAEVHDVQQKLRALDLAGAKEATALSAEEQELAEEAEAEVGMYGGDMNEDPNKPRFVFLATVADADYEKALAEAFKKATAQADRLARAAGRQLGELRSVSAYDQGQSYDDGEMYNRMGSSAYNMLQRLRQKQGNSDELTAAGITPGAVKLNVTLVASYKLREQ
jgi:uncharacterized protein YggE